MTEIDIVHPFDYTNIPETLLTPEIMQAIANLHEHKGKQELFLESNIDELSTLLDVAKIQSTGASNRIEGIFTSDKRLKELVTQKTEPHNRSESEIAGYREVLLIIHESYDHIPPKPGIILQLHRDLYSYVGENIGGTYKNSDNVIAETDSDGHQKTRFVPISAFQTSEAMENLCSEFSRAWDKNSIDKLILIPMFILDFLCIHPFNDGNGRMSRLLTLLLFYRAEYFVGRYISLEMIIEKSKETYYEALQSSSVRWHEGKNDYEPFLKYYLSILERAYTDFEGRIKLLRKNRSKSQCIREIIDQRIGKITKKEIMDLCPHISRVTVERTLTELVKVGYIEKIGGGPATAYIKKQK